MSSSFLNIQETPGLEKDSLFNNIEIREKIINFILRNCSIITNKEIIKDLIEQDYNKIASKFLIDIKYIKEIVHSFLKRLSYFYKFLKLYKFKWPHNLEKLYIKSKIFLFRVYRLAPVFSYKRAKINLKILQSALSKRNFWPSIHTQLAIIIYITDKKGQYNKKIIQKNIRALCNCSAYAFHRTRNILKIK
ncbi:MAG: hypothetical protein ACTSPD_07225 [Promethearchaeota archaeon]